MKHRLRHPIRAIREPFGTAGLIVACVALIAALGGTALAAKGALSGKQKKEVAKIAKKEARKYADSNPGAPGLAGAPGAAGKDGTNGTNGTDGTDGENGKSVLAEAIPTSGTGSATCHNHGGTKFEVEGSGASEHVCNGEPGVIHPGETLAPEASETGTWAVSGLHKQGETIYVPLSFPVPLEQSLGAAAAHYIPGPTVAEFLNEEAPVGPVECEEGTYEEPKAAPGNLCIYEGVDGTDIGQGGLSVGASGFSLNPEEFFGEGVGRSGAILDASAHLTSPPGPETTFARGSWVVTAEE